jgi:hypothetical protein
MAERVEGQLRELSPFRTGRAITNAVSGEATSDAPGGAADYDVGHPITLKGP